VALGTAGRIELTADARSGLLQHKPLRDVKALARDIAGRGSVDDEEKDQIKSVARASGLLGVAAGNPPSSWVAYFME
jgi:hypothetical protein